VVDPIKGVTLLGPVPVLCRYIIQPALSNERVLLNAAGQVELKAKTRSAKAVTL
jgi:hypothetical protein